MPSYLALEKKINYFKPLKEIISVDIEAIYLK